jgi:hypothetical protein
MLRRLVTRQRASALGMAAIGALATAMLFSYRVLAQQVPGTNQGAQPPHQASVSGSMPRNLISPMVPYEQGIAHIEAQDAARPKAVQPKLPGTVSGAPDQPATPPADGQPAPVGGQSPR